MLTASLRVIQNNKALKLPLSLTPVTDGLRVIQNNKALKQRGHYL